MNGTYKLNILYDNEPFVENMESDWGFACHIKNGETNILFDTGENGSILLSNMKKLNIDPKKIEIIFLTHYHHDHTGGMIQILEMNPRVKVYFPKSFPEELVNTVKNFGADPVPVSGFKELAPNVFTLGEFQGNIPEQAMVIKTEKGLVVITGCAHPGIISILEKVKNIFPNESIQLVLGGFHLYKNNKAQIKEIADKIKDIGVNKVAPCHCSGIGAIQLFKTEFGENFINIGAGKSLEI